jgi:hypothetical protein
MIDGLTKETTVKFFTTDGSEFSEDDLHAASVHQAGLNLKREWYSGFDILRFIEQHEEEIMEFINSKNGDYPPSSRYDY